MYFLIVNVYLSICRSAKNFCGTSEIGVRLHILTDSMNDRSASGSFCRLLAVVSTDTAHSPGALADSRFTAAACPRITAMQTFVSSRNFTRPAGGCPAHSPAAGA